jgi:uncharacterized coiled-coil protein SlyX
MEVKVERLAGQVGVLGQRLLEMERRLGENAGTVQGIHELARSVDLVAQKLELLAEKIEGRLSQIEERQMKQGERIGALEHKPAAKWENVQDTLLKVIVTGLAGVLLGYLLSGI